MLKFTRSKTQRNTRPVHKTDSKWGLIEPEEEHEAGLKQLPQATDEETANKTPKYRQLNKEQLLKQNTKLKIDESREAGAADELRANNQIYLFTDNQHNISNHLQEQHKHSQNSHIQLLSPKVESVNAPHTTDQLKTESKAFLLKNQSQSPRERVQEKICINEDSLDRDKFAPSLLEGQGQIQATQNGQQKSNLPHKRELSSPAEDIKRKDEVQDVQNSSLLKIEPSTAKKSVKKLSQLKFLPNGSRSSTYQAISSNGHRLAGLNLESVQAHYPDGFTPHRKLDKLSLLSFAALQDLYESVLSTSHSGRTLSKPLEDSIARGLRSDLIAQIRALMSQISREQSECVSITHQYGEETHNSTDLQQTTQIPHPDSRDLQQQNQANLQSQIAKENETGTVRTVHSQNQKSDLKAFSSSESPQGQPIKAQQKMVVRDAQILDIKYNNQLMLIVRKFQRFSHKTRGVANKKYNNPEKQIDQPRETENQKIQNSQSRSLEEQRQDLMLSSNGDKRSGFERVMEYSSQSRENKNLGRPGIECDFEEKNVHDQLQQNQSQAENAQNLEIQEQSRQSEIKLLEQAEGNSDEKNSIKKGQGQVQIPQNTVTSQGIDNRVNKIQNDVRNDGNGQSLFRENSDKNRQEQSPSPKFQENMEADQMKDGIKVVAHSIHGNLDEIKIKNRVSDTQYSFANMDGFKSGSGQYSRLDQTPIADPPTNNQSFSLQLPQSKLDHLNNQSLHEQIIQGNPQIQVQVQDADATKDQSKYFSAQDVSQSSQIQMSTSQYRDLSSSQRVNDPHSNSKDLSSLKSGEIQNSKHQLSGSKFYLNGAQGMQWMSILDQLKNQNTEE